MPRRAAGGHARWPPLRPNAGRSHSRRPERRGPDDLGRRHRRHPHHGGSCPLARRCQRSADHRQPQPRPVQRDQALLGRGTGHSRRAWQRVLDRYRGGPIDWVGHERLGSVERVADPTSAHLHRVLALVDVAAIRRRQFRVLSTPTTARAVSSGGGSWRSSVAASRSWAASRTAGSSTPPSRPPRTSPGSGRQSRQPGPTSVSAKTRTPTAWP